MSKFQTLYQEKLKELQPKNENSPRQDLLITLGKLLGGAIIIFTFLSGVIFTVIPLARNIGTHFHTHILEPIHRWMAAEPTTGNSLMFLFYATISVVILYIFRNKIQVLFLWLLASGERAANEAAVKIEKRKLEKELKKPYGGFIDKFEPGDTFVSPSRTVNLDAIEPAEDDYPQF